MTLKEQYMQYPTVAYCTDFEGIEIKDILYGIEDYIVFLAGTMGNNPTCHKAKVYYSGERPYFKLYGRRIYLDNCMRV